MPRWLRVTRRAAPHVKVTGPLVSLVDRKKLELDVPPIIKVSSPDEARAIIARELPSRPDYIKVWFIHQKDGNLPAEEEIVRAAADAVHAAGLRLIVHATELVTAKAALRAGADVLVHSVMDAPVERTLSVNSRSTSSSRTAKAIGWKRPPRLGVSRSSSV